jgi:crossover junction endodeoxyribonuclease RusA
VPHTATTLAPLALPWPPSVNRAWRVAPGSAGTARRHVYLAPAVLAYRIQVALLVRQARAARQVPPTAVTQRLMVELACAPPDRRARDLDNLGKVLLDSLTHAGLWRDDRQIDVLTFCRHPPHPGGLVVLRVSLLD